MNPVVALVYALTVTAARKLESRVSRVTQTDRDRLHARVQRVQAECDAITAQEAPRDGC